MAKQKKLVFLLFVTLLMSVFYSCKQSANATQSEEKSEASIEEAAATPIPQQFILPDWAKTSTIYEVNIRQYTEEGTINAFSDHIPRLKNLGVEILWLMPVYPISETKRKGTLGSYYAVSDYTEVNPAFGTKQDLLNLIDKIHAYGMKVILDWVPNHTGWDHKWIRSNPDYYTRGKDGKITDPLDPETGESYGWTDVADLNYDNKDMRQAMIKDLVYWVDEHNVDGYRMDIAFGVPNDFWRTVVDTLTAINPEVFLLAESEETTHLNEDLFHAAYAWSFHHLMNDIANGKKSTEDVVKWIKETRSNFKKGNLMHFITNHDENSWNGSEIERMGIGPYQTFATLTFMLDGIPLVYSGQEEPLEKRLEFFEKDNINFKGYKAAAFYTDLIHFKKKNPAIWNLPYGGDIALLSSNNSDILAFEREAYGNKVIAIFNLSNQDQKVTFEETIQINNDLFKKTPATFNQGQAYYMKPWQFYIGKAK